MIFAPNKSFVVESVCSILELLHVPRYAIQNTPLALPLFVNKQTNKQVSKQINTHTPTQFLQFSTTCGP